MIEIALKIDGWMQPDELIWLAARARKAERILEVGCYKGRSTRALADNTSGVIFAVDPWNGSYFNNDGTPAKWIDTNVYSQFEKNLNEHIGTKVYPLKGTLDDISFDFKFDLIFLDGDHRYNFVKDDIRRAKGLVKAGGIIAGHDYGRSDWPGVKQAVDEEFNKINLRESIWWVNV